MTVPRNSSLLTFNEYRDSETKAKTSVSTEGLLLEYETLELRVHPPNVVIDNDVYDDRTVITVDSANRPGTLVEVRPPAWPGMLFPPFRGMHVLLVHRWCSA